MASINNKFEFIKYIQKAKTVKRKNLALSSRPENDAEHSWSLAFMAWTLHKPFEKELKTNIDLLKMIKMALIHDLIEIETGDFQAWDKSVDASKKAEMEKEAAKKIFSKLEGTVGEEMLMLWEEFEENESLESKLMKAIDRFSPALHRFDTEQGWIEENATELNLDDLQLPRIKISETLVNMYTYLKYQAVSSGQLIPSSDNVYKPKIDKETLGLLNFIIKTRKLKGILKQNFAEENRKENSAEHSWMTTVMCWVLFEDINAEVGHKLDLLRLLKMSLIHDLPKIYTGDTSVWDKYLLDFKDQIAIDKEIISSTLFQWLPRDIQNEMKEIYTVYMQTLLPVENQYNEATVMRGIERIAPAIQRVITKQGWKAIPATEEELDNIQLPRIGFSPTLVQIYEMVKVEAKEDQLL